MSQPRPMPQQFHSLFNDIERGRLKIPQFQRDFVWSVKKAAALLDSIVKEYPIGAFIFWKTRERLRSVRNIGGIDLPEPDSGDYVNYILDGQQRITTIYAAMKGVKDVMRSDGKTDDYSKIYVNFEPGEDEKIITDFVEDEESRNIIKLTDLLYGGVEFITSNVPSEYHGKYDTYKSAITSYLYSVIQVDDIPLNTATEIFTRVNLGGVNLTLFEIMAAKTFDPDRNFDLAEKFNDLIEELKEIGYETISAVSILQSISLVLSKSRECKKKTILGLDKDAFIDVWGEVVEAFKMAIDYLIIHYRIPVSKLLPYNAILVPFTYYFYKEKVRPSDRRRELLEDFFWRISLSGRYSSSVESKLAQDVKRIDAIVGGKDPLYDWPININPDYILEHGWFSASRSYVKAILCLYASKAPKSFNDNSMVNIDNAWLKQANSKNYHHFFPKAYLKKYDVDEYDINNVVNITIVDDYLNKRLVRAKAPSKYMKEFRSQNKDLTETMKSHLIGDLDEFGVWSDDYDTFLEKRAELISKELQQRIIKRDIDKESQTDLEQYFVDSEEEEDLEEV